VAAAESTTGPPTAGPPTAIPTAPYGPSQYGPPPGFGGAQFPRPPGKPPGPRKIIAIVLAAVVVVILVGVVALSQISVPATMATPSTYPPYSYSAPTTAPRAPSSSTAPAVTPPSVTPSATLPSVTLPPTSVSPRTSQPPSPPRPQPVNALGDNPLFADIGLPRVQCSWPAWQPDLASQRAYYTAVNACLDKVWAPVLAARNLPFTPPKLVVFDRPITEQPPCRERLVQPDEPNFACGDTIYVPARYLPDVEHLLPQSFDVYLEMAAHEYGHYVQNLSGVGGAADDQRSAAGANSPAGLLVSRRLEL